MKAIAVAPHRKEILLIDNHEEPRIAKATDVKLRMLEVGICGTDKEICAFEYGTPPAGSDHLVIGHEALGRIVEVGAAVIRLKVGDLVVPMVRRPCRHDNCLSCRQDRQDFCYTGDFRERGIKEEHGFLTEYVVDDEKYMILLPPELRDVGILIEPLTIAEKALIQVLDIQERLPWGCIHHRTMGKEKGHCHRAVVLGAGPVGILGAMAIKARDFETYVYSRGPIPNKKSTLLESIGIHYVCSETTSPEELAEQVGNIDLIYEAVGASGIAFASMKALGTNGIFVFTGVPGRKAPIELDTDLLMRNLVLKNQVFYGTVNAGRDAFEAAIGDLAGFMQLWPEAVRSIITGRYPMEKYRELLLGRVGGIKNLIAINED